MQRAPVSFSNIIYSRAEAPIKARIPPNGIERTLTVLMEIIAADSGRKRL